MEKYKILNINGKTDNEIGEVLFVEVSPINEENNSTYFSSTETITLVYPSTEKNLFDLMSLVNSYIPINLDDFREVQTKELPKGNIITVYKHLSCYTDTQKIKDFLVINFDKSKSPDKRKDTIELQITELKKVEEGKFYTQAINTMSVIIPFNSDNFLSILNEHPQKIIVGLDLNDFKKVSKDFQVYELYVHKSLFIQNISEYISAIRKFNILYTIMN
ncbi:MAG: hypothetical protein LBV71_06425 [Prevotella sp.]|jgi:hypothetical protein|nr:hypothetical protein [Prevotella sp.]